MKKIFLIFLMTVLLTLAACGKTESPTPPAATEATEPTEVTAAETTEVIEPTTPLDNYMDTISTRSEAFKLALEREELTQLDMNETSQALYDLWDSALNYLWTELRNSMTEEDFALLQKEQRTWIANKEAAVAEAGKEYENGSMYDLIVTGTAAQLTEERVWELYDLLRQFQ